MTLSLLKKEMRSLGHIQRPSSVTAIIACLDIAKTPGYAGLTKRNSI